MRSETSPSKVQQLMRALGERARGPGKIYFTGGATALLLGWRQSTVDVDLRLDPEPAGIFEALAHLKNELDLNVELASPQDFIPELPGWRERSLHIATEGSIDFYHYDFYAQALAKIERGHERDLKDVLQMGQRGLIQAARLEELFQAIRPELLRYPGIEPQEFAAKLASMLAVLREHGGGSGGPA